MTDWANVIVPLGTAVLAGAAAIGGSWTGARNEHAQWLRNERRLAYADMLTRTEAHTVAPQNQTDSLFGMRHAFALVQVLGPETVADAGVAVVKEATRLQAMFANEGLDPRSQDTRDSVGAYESARASFSRAARAALSERRAR